VYHKLGVSTPSKSSLDRVLGLADQRNLGIRK